jgi:hypothetical protein
VSRVCLNRRTRFAQLPVPQKTIEKIIAVTAAMERFWRRSHGWAPAEAATLLATARLDRQTSFTHTLSDYLQPFSRAESEARQILGYATLRSLCEGVLKLFFAVWLKHYLRDRDAVRDRSGSIVPPEAVQFDRLIAFYTKKIDADHEIFLRRVQRRGNAIHHFTDRDIGTQDELIEDIIHFQDFLESMDAGLPYPDDIYDRSGA